VNQEHVKFGLNYPFHVPLLGSDFSLQTVSRHLMLSSQ
jgi:hypothetical protein